MQGEIGLHDSPTHKTPICFTYQINNDAENPQAASPIYVSVMNENPFTYLTQEIEGGQEDCGTYASSNNQHAGIAVFADHHI